MPCLVFLNPHRKFDLGGLFKKSFPSQMCYTFTIQYMGSYQLYFWKAHKKTTLTQIPF